MVRPRSAALSRFERVAGNDRFVTDEDARTVLLLQTSSARGTDGGLRQLRRHRNPRRGSPPGSPARGSRVLAVLGALAALVTAAAGCAGGGPTGSAPAPGCDPAAPEPGFRSLFDGTEASLREWRQAGPGGFRLEDCALHSTGGMGLLWHPEPLGDVELRVDWRAEGDDNSGVFVGFPDPDDDPWVAVTRGREVQIDGSDVAVRSTAAVYDVTAPDEAARDAALRPPGEWNTFAVTVAEGRVVVRLNGVVVTEHRETDPERLAVPAHVGLQNHSEVDRVSFRRVRVRDIDDEEG